MLGKWIKSWRGKSTEMSLNEWNALCQRLQKELNLKFDLCSRAYFELEVNGEVIEIWIKVDKNKQKVLIRTF